MKILLSLILMLMPTVASAQLMLGRATAIDGDTIAFGEERYRLHGIDAVEASQNCSREGQPWQCGAEAKQLLASLLSKGSLECQAIDRDQYGRTVAVCRAAGNDLGNELIAAGLAVALPQFSSAYVSAEANAKASKTGIWGGEFQLPADYRAANPKLYAEQQRPQRRLPERFVPSTRVDTNQGGVYYRNCAQAWAAGAAPIYRGQPGYRSEMDGDGDGIACEPYRGR